MARRCQARFQWAMAAMNLALWSCVFPKTLEPGTLRGVRMLELGVLPRASPGQQYILFPSHCCLGRAPLQTTHPGFNSLMAFGFPLMPCLIEASSGPHWAGLPHGGHMLSRPSQCSALGSFMCLHFPQPELSLALKKTVLRGTGVWTWGL